jgi:hypothetical protein
MLKLDVKAHEGLEDLEFPKRDGCDAEKPLNTFKNPTQIRNYEVKKWWYLRDT